MRWCGTARPRFVVGLCGKDLHAAIDLVGVGTENFAVEPVCQLDGESGFADPGWAGDDDGGLIPQIGGARHVCPLRPLRR